MGYQTRGCEEDVSKTITRKDGVQLVVTIPAYEPPASKRDSKILLSSPARHEPKSFVMDHRRLQRWFTGIVLSMLGTGLAFAGNGFGQTALNVGNNLNDTGGLIQSAFYLSGFGLVGYGIHTMRKAHKNEGQGKEKMSHGVMESMFGAALVAVPTFAGHAVNTMFSNATTGAQNSTAAQVQTG